ESVGAVAERLAHRVHRLRLLVPDGTTARLVAAVLQLLATIERIPSHDKQLGRLRAAAEGTISNGPGGIDAFATAMHLDSVRGVPADVLAVAWADNPLTPVSTRLAWLCTLAEHRPAVLASPSSWQGIDVAGLQCLAGAAETRAWLLGTETGRVRR